MSGSTSSQTSSVSFGPIIIREYERVLGHGDQYMSLELGWEYQDAQILDLEEYEARQCATKSGVPPTAPQRLDILNKYGFSIQEVKEHEHAKILQKAMERRRECKSKGCSLGKRFLRLMGGR